MMVDREAIMPLCVGLVVALLLNALLIPLGMIYGSDGGARRALVPLPDMDPVLQKPEQIRFGQEVSHVSTVAWIPFEAFEQLIAPEGQTEQPALQTEVDPVPDAPVPEEPTPPAMPTDQPRPIASDAAPQEAVEPAPAQAAAQQPDVPLPRPDPDGELARVEPFPAEQVRPAPQPSPEAGRSQTQPEPDPAPPGEPGQEARPTAAPRTESESPPVRVTSDTMDVRPGQVIAAEGIQIITARPQLTLISRMTALPVNPIARITFDRDGSVIKAELIRGTGYADWDGPILASLYRWRASGERFEAMNRQIVGEWRIILGGE